MTDRAAYIRGLHKLADLLAEHDEITLPNGFGKHARIYAYEEPLAQARALIAAMQPSPTVEIDHSNIDWLTISGRLDGLPVTLLTPADQVCERQITGVHRASDGSVHEVTEWVIPAELRPGPSVRGGPELDPGSEDDYRAEQADYELGEGL